MHRISENLVCDLDIFFATVANGEISSNCLEDMYLLTGVRNISPFGLYKLGDIFFCDMCTAPKLSTCEYIVTLPIRGWEQAVTYAIKF